MVTEGKIIITIIIIICGPFTASPAVILTKFRITSCVPIDKTIFPACERAFRGAQKQRTKRESLGADPWPDPAQIVDSVTRDPVPTSMHTIYTRWLIRQYNNRNAVKWNKSLVTPPPSISDNRCTGPQQKFAEALFKIIPGSLRRKFLLTSVIPGPQRMLFYHCSYVIFGQCCLYTCWVKINQIQYFLLQQ